MATSANSHAVTFSKHAREALSPDALDAEDVLAAIRANATLLREYPEDNLGLSCLIGAWLASGDPVHVVFGVSREPWVVITVYRPDPDRWSEDFTQRRR